MDIEKIRSLVKLVEGSDIRELDVQHKNIRVRITRGDAPEAPAHSGRGMAFQPSPLSHTGETHPQQPPHPGESREPEGVTDTALEICSPMVGTFFRSPSPEADPYIKTGDTIEPGKILCIIEAMKLMNELESEVSGTVKKILVENGQPVEYNQPLFLIETV